MVAGRVLEGAECNGDAGSGWRGRSGRGLERTRPSGGERSDVRGDPRTWDCVGMRGGVAWVSCRNMGISKRPASGSKPSAAHLLPSTVRGHQSGKRKVIRHRTDVLLAITTAVDAAALAARAATLATGITLSARLAASPGAVASGATASGSTSGHYYHPLLRLPVQWCWHRLPGPAQPGVHEYPSARHLHVDVGRLRLRAGPVQVRLHAGAGQLAPGHIGRRRLVPT